MESSNSTFNGRDLGNPYVMIISVYVRFWLYLIPNILSVLCSIFVLYYLLFDRKLREALYNHIIIIILVAGLIYELTTVPLMLYYYYFGDTWEMTLPISAIRFWTFIDSLGYQTQLIGLAWASIERHILIFHRQWVSTEKTRFFAHYLPLMVILIYCFTYYFVFDLFPFCGDLHYPSPTNGVPFSCIMFHPIMGKFDGICNLIIPTFIIFTSSLALLVRVLRQKARLSQGIQWRKQRKMTIQLLSISFLYLFFNFPRTILLIVNLFGILTYASTSVLVHTAFFAIYTVFLYPFVCCGAMPEIGTKLKKLFFCRKQKRTIVPQTLRMNQIGTNQTATIRTDVH
jgi:hypothetical protein